MISALDELLKIEDVDERKRAIKNAFSPVTPPIDITENELLTCTILANLTTKIGRVEQVPDLSDARTKLKDRKWLNRCVKTVHYRHTHNIKYPDYRSKGTIRLQAQGKIPNGYVSSYNLENYRLGWSQNSADINVAIFLCADFIWRGEILTLSDAILKKENIFRECLINIGMYKKDLKQIIQVLSQIHKEQTIINLTETSLTLLRFPFEINGYICLTPVPNHVMQTEIHNWTSQHNRHAEKMFCPRSSSVGSLAACVGGRLSVFKSLPRGLKRQHTIKAKHGNWLTSESIKLLHNLATRKKWLLPPNKHKELKCELVKQLQQVLVKWMKNKNNIELDVSSQAEQCRLFTQSFNAEISNLPKAESVAYHPDLTRIIENSFTTILKSNCSLGAVATTELESRFLLLPSLTVSNANAESCSYLVGLPSMIGIFGFIHNFQFRLYERFGLKVDFQEFAICLHSYSFHKRGVTKEQYYTINDVQKIPGIVDSRQCDFSVSLLIKVNDLALDKEHILACLPQKLCGGAVHIGLPNLSSVDVYNDFKQAVEAIPLTKGKWLAIDDSNNPFNNVFDMMSIIEKRDDLVAGCVGYHFLELPEDKIGSLDNIQHVFAEPILAAVRMSSFVFGDTHEKLIWQYQKNSTSLYLTN